ncbi:MAG: mammalian cell entry protein [Mycolicibacterium cosmeticum]|nr:mammalian cell entry protein [Mycolicibacterium cosmeticum]
MEDQPTDSGDLTTGSDTGRAEVQPTGKTARVAPAAPDVEADPEVGADGADAEPAVEPVLVPHRTAGRPLKIAAATAAVLFVAAGAFAGATAQQYLSDRALVHTKVEIARTATSAITTLWTYTPEDMESLPDRAEKYLAGDFAAQYRQYIDAIVAPNKQAQVSNSTQVLGAAIESIGPAQATALVYTNSVATSPVTKNIPSLRYLSYRLTLQRRDSAWLITEMTPVTSLDLTPRL